MSVTLTELAEATAAMRQCQREYFRVCRDPYRRQPMLQRSKVAEAKVDRLLALIARDAAAPDAAEIELFGAEG